MNKTEKKKKEADEFLERIKREYEINVERISKDYERTKDKYNGVKDGLNNVRGSLESEISILHGFLNRLGNIGKKLTVFDYAFEDPAPVLSVRRGDGIKRPECVRGLFVRSKNNRVLLNYYVEILKEEEAYINDISAKELALRYLGIATDIARIYYDTVVFIRNFIKDTIVPELSFIYASLIADGVLNEMISGGDVLSAKLTGISEYKDTNKDIHYRFVQNVHDFYRVSTTFFEKKILTDFLADRVISEEEKEAFKESVKEIYDKADVVISEKVL